MRDQEVDVEHMSIKHMQKYNMCSLHILKITKEECNNREVGNFMILKQG